MISFIKGKIADKKPDQLIVEVGGFGFEVRAPAGTIEKSPGAGEQVSLYTYLHVRDDALQLYGFDSTYARDLFLKLMSVSGFGAQKALSVLSVFSPEGFEDVIQRGESDALTVIPGIGKKSAQRLLLEMKDKVEPAADDLSELSEAVRRPHQEAMEALLQLGYSRIEAHDVLKGFKPAEERVTVEEMLQFALKRLGPA